MGWLCLQDSLMDLLQPLKKGQELPRLEIKKDQKGMVVVQGAHMVEVRVDRQT
jgi:hypothetical protein